MSENSFSLTDQGKEVADKIPDLWFDWYGRLLPGALLILLGIWKYNLSTEKVTENIWLIFAAGYLIGHLLQPFSSGLLQWKYDDLKGSKSKKLSKLYSELVGFFSCFLGSVIFLIYSICTEFEISKLRDLWFNNWMTPVSILILFGATYARKKAYNRKKERDEAEKAKGPKENQLTVNIKFPDSINEELKKQILQILEESFKANLKPTIPLKNN